MEAGDAAEWLLHAESDLTYAKLGQAEPAILRNQVAFLAYFDTFQSALLQS